MTFLFYIMLFQAAVSDSDCARISNELTGYGLFYGMVLAYIKESRKDFFTNILAVVLVFAVLAMMRAIKGLGGGDVKLLSVCGVYLEVTEYLFFLWWFLIIALVLGIVNRILFGSHRIRMGLPILLAALMIVWK